MAKLAFGLNMSLIDEYQIYLYPVVLGKGTPMFPGPCPPLRLPPAARPSFFSSLATAIPLARVKPQN